MECSVKLGILLVDCIAAGIPLGVCVCLYRILLFDLASGSLVHTRHTCVCVCVCVCGYCTSAHNHVTEVGGLGSHGLLHFQIASVTYEIVATHVL